MSCQIKYNPDNTLDIKAPNGEDSLLFQTIKELPGVDNEYKALDSWLKVYTDSFKEWYGLDWETITEKEKATLIKDGYLDENGEPTIFYRGDFEGKDSFNYSPSVGKFGQGVYIAQNITQAESFAADTGKQVYPVFLKPGKTQTFKSVISFKQAVAKYNNINTVPTDEDVVNYVDHLHRSGITISGKGVMGQEFNTFSRDNVKSIFTQGFELSSGLLYDTKSLDKVMSTEEQESSKADSFLTELANKLVANLNMPENSFEIINEDDALLITKDAQNPWSGQPAFYFNNKIYFIRGKLSFDSVIHEFSHPLVRAIGHSNTALFNKLFDDLIKTSEGASFLAQSMEEYPELSGDHMQIKEETIVKAITAVSIQPEVAKGFAGFIKKIVYALKQLFRSLPGKVNTKNLSLDTTIKELSDMLVNNSWEVNMETISNEDIVAYMTEFRERTESLRKASETPEGRAAIYQQLKLNSQAIRAQLERLKKSPSKKEIEEVLKTPAGEFILDEMRATIGKKLSRREQIALASSKKLDDLKEFEKRIEALSFNIEHINDSVEKMQEQIKDLVDEPDQKAALQQLTFYVESMKDWNIFLEEFKNNAEVAGIDTTDAVIKDISEIQDKIRTNRNAIRSIYRESVSEALYDIFDSTKTEILKAKNDLIEKRKEQLAKASNERDKARLQSEINEIEEFIAKIPQSKEDMAKWITGEMGDTGYIHSHLENFIANQDPSISSFAKFLKQNLSNVQSRLHNKYSEFANRMGPMFKELGINPSQLNKFSETFLFGDSSYTKDEDGNIKEHKVLTFLNEFQNYKYTTAKLNDLIKEADEEFQKTRSDEDLEKLADLQALKDEHMNLFFKRKYVDEYYNADQILDNSPYGPELREQIDDIMSNIRTYQSTHPDSSTVYEDYEIVEGLWKEYKQMFSTYDNFGEKKIGEELEKAEVLREWRNAKQDFHGWNTKEGAFQGAYDKFKIKLKIQLEQGGLKEGTAEYEAAFEAKKQAWIDRNTQLKIKDSFYVARDVILTKISDIMSNIGNQTFDTEWENILDSLQGRRDVDGQPIGSEMTDEHLASIKAIEEKIEAAKEQMIGTSGLTPAEQDEYSYFIKKFSDGERLTPEELSRYKELKSKRATEGLSKSQKIELRILFEKLNELQQRKATDYYIDIVNEFYKDIHNKRNPETSYDEITHENVDKLLDPSTVQELFEYSPEFENWFNKNHFVKYKYNVKTQKREATFQRIYAWSVVRPNDSKYLESTNIYDESGKIIETIQGVPNIKYKERYVKPEYHSGYDKSAGTVDEFAHLDQQGNNIPRNLEEMQQIQSTLRDRLEEHNQKLEEVFGHKFSYDHYINHDYLKLKEKGGIEFKVLEELKKFHLESQEGLDKHQSLGFELPRFRKRLDEYVTSGKAKDDISGVGGQLFKGAASLLGKRKDDFEDGLNFDAQQVYVDLNLFEAENLKVPVKGKYNLEIDQVSRDITTSLFSYYQSAEQNKSLVEMQPMAKALKELAQDNPVDIKNQVKNAYTRNLLPGKSNNRKKVIEGMIDMVFEGKKLTEGSNKANSIKIINGLLGLASHTYFAFDITSAMKNYLGARWQISLESFGNRYYSWKSYQQGRPWAASAMSQISMQVYREEDKSLAVQIVDAFDPAQGRSEDKFGESISRSLTRDALRLNWTTSHRKWLETEATLELFSAIMHDTKVEQTIDGETKNIRYINAWEKDNKGRLVLKEGIDKKWDLGGDQFNKVKFKVHEVSNFLQGAYSSFDQPLASRYIGFRMVSSMKKYFTKMFLHRWGGTNLRIQKVEGSLFGRGFRADERLNVALDGAHIGFYLQNLVTLSKIVESGGRHLMYMTKEEKQAFMLGAVQIFKLMLFNLAMFLVFGWDPDDPDRWEAMKERSGALPTFLTHEEASENFNLSGWLHNHAILTAVSAQAEFEHFMPVPGYGLKDQYNVIAGDLSVSAAGSVKLLLNLASSLFFTLTGNDIVEYQKDAGPMTYQQAGSNKFWVDFYKLFGIKDKFVDPVKGTKGITNMRNNYRG